MIESTGLPELRRREFSSLVATLLPRKTRGNLLQTQKLFQLAIAICAGELSFKSNIHIDEPFLCQGLLDDSDFVRACCANVLHKYIPLQEETITILSGELVRLQMMELCEELPLYSKKLKYYAIKTIDEDEKWKAINT